MGYFPSPSTFAGFLCFTWSCLRSQNWALTQKLNSMENFNLWLDIRAFFFRGSASNRSCICSNNSRATCFEDVGTWKSPRYVCKTLLRFPYPLSFDLDVEPQLEFTINAFCPSGFCLLCCFGSTTKVQSNSVHSYFSTLH